MSLVASPKRVAKETTEARHARDCSPKWQAFHPQTSAHMALTCWFRLVLAHKTVMDLGFSMAKFS